MKIRALSVSLCIAFGMAMPWPVQAGGFDTGRVGGEFGHAAAPNPFALYYNPAALGGTRRLHVAIDGTLAVHGASFDRKDTTVDEPAAAKGANTGRSKLLDVIGGPQAAMSARFGWLTLGAGWFSPTAASARFQGNSRFRGNTTYPGAEDGTARWQIVHGDIQIIDASAGAALTIPQVRLSIGAAFDANYNLVELTRASAPAGDDNLANEGRAHMKARGWTYSGAAGLMWEAIPKRLWVGLSYRAPPGGYGGMKLRGTLTTDYGGSVSATKTTLHQQFPDVFRYALRYHTEAYELRLFGDYTRWSMFGDQCLTGRGKACKVKRDGSANAEVINNTPRRWRDTVGLRLGGSYYFSERWEALAGLGYDSNAIPDSNLEASIIDSHDFSLALGGRVKLFDRLALALSYTQMYWLPRDTTGKSTLDTYQRPSGLPDSGGEYRQWVSMFNAFVEMYLD